MYASASEGDNARLTRDVLLLLSQGRAGLVTDVDGTISAIQLRPEDAFVLPRAREALAGLRDLLTVVGVVSGRSVGDARQMVGVDGLVYVGNHGLELWTTEGAQVLPEARPWVPHVAEVLDELARALPPHFKDGVLMENKGATASVHYRLAPDPEKTQEILLDVLARCAATSGLRIEEGRRVINLLPPLTVTKGSALSWLVQEYALDRIVYLGDDVTDAHAFQALQLLRLGGNVSTLAIAVVGPETPTSVRDLADTAVPSVEAVADLLWAVLDGLRTSDRMKSRAPGVGSD